MATRTIRILCLGDSLTSGYTSPLGPNHRPYAIKLKEVLERGLQGVTVVATVDGEPGALVQGQGFLQRMMAQYMNLGDGQTFDWVIILGGTNDLPGVMDAEAIYDALNVLYNSALGKGSKVLALTVPEVTGPDGRSYDDLDECRDQLNGFIDQYHGDNFHVFDLKEAIPNITLSYEDRKKYWVDGVHRTAEGYDQMGREIGEALLDLIRYE